MSRKDNKDNEDCPVTRRECALIQKNIADKVSSLRNELLIAVSVSTSWITLLVLILNYIHKI